MGHLLTSNGLKPDPEKVGAVKEMPIPDGATCGEKVKAVKRFLGFVNYLVSHSRGLNNKDAIWCWEKHYQEAFDKVKEMAINFPVLRYYDVNLLVTIQCDSSDIGFGV